MDKWKEDQVRKTAAIRGDLAWDPSDFPVTLELPCFHGSATFNSQSLGQPKRAAGSSWIPEAVACLTIGNERSNAYYECPGEKEYDLSFCPTRT